MKVVYNKLRSKSGASIILALLLVLITSTVGVVILSSGTAASGRMARLWEDERHYMLVTSAADVLIDEINVKKNEETEEIENKVTIEIRRTNKDDPSPKVFVNRAEYDPAATKSLLTDAAMCFIFGGNGEPPSDTKTISKFFNAESLFSIIKERNESESVKNYKIQTAINGENTNPVDVQLTLVKSDGSFKTKLSSKSSGNDYGIIIRFIPTFKEGLTVKPKTEREPQTEVKKYEIWWEAQEIEVG